MQPIEPSKTATVTETQDTRVFFRIASVATALALGCLAATVEAMRGENSGLSFEFSVRSLPAFAVGLAAGFGYWALVARGRTAARWASVLLALAGVGAFMYPLRFVPTNGLTELAKGFVPAVLALTMVGVLLWGVKQFFDSDDRQADKGTKSPQDSHSLE